MRCFLFFQESFGKGSSEPGDMVYNITIRLRKTEKVWLAMEERKLIDWFCQQGRAAIAFSGGVDSTFLLACAKQALGRNVKAYTCRSAFVPEWELNEAKEFCKEHEIDLQIIPLDVLADENIAKNPINRCYLCKKSVFGAITAQARQDGFSVVCDGANVDDAECRCFLHAITSFLEWERLWADEPVSYYREQAAGLRCYFVNFLLIPYIIQHLTEILNCLEASRLN